MSEHHEETHHVVPLRYYIGTFVTLLFLTIITVTASQLHFSATTGIIIALFIAIIKASLVLFIFMGLKWDKGFNIVIVATTFLFMSIFFFFVLGDEMTRGGADSRERGHFGLHSPVKAPGTGEHEEAH